MRSALVRWWRRPIEVVAAVLLALLVLVAPFAATIAAAVVQASTDEHWRGAYDILVLGEGSTAAMRLENETLIDPNFGNISGPTIPDALVERVQALDGVEVAAPIAFLGRLGDVTDLPNLQIPGDVLREHPQLVLDLDLQVVTDDGLGTRLASTYFDTTLRIDSTAWDGSPDLPVNDSAFRVDGPLGGGSWMQDGILRLILLPLPSAASTVFAIDPTREAALLSQAAPPDFATLQAMDTLLEEAAGPSASTPTIERVQQLGRDAPEIQPLAALVPDFWSRPAVRGAYGTQARLAPVLQAEDAYPPLTIRGSISRVEVTAGDEVPWRVAARSANREVIGEVQVAVDEQLQPFRSTSIGIPWPGENAVQSNYVAQTFRATGIGPLELTPIEGIDEQVPAFHVTPQGIVRPVPQDTRLDDDGTAVGQTQSYRSDAPESQLVLQGPPSSGTGAPLIVGTYDANTIVRSLGSSNAPLGAYDPAAAMLIAGPDGVPIDPVRLEPTLHGLGLVAQPSAALTTYLGAAAFGIEEPTTAIRVRVAGIDGYGDSAVRRITAIAEEIERMGLDTHVVAGASATPIDLRVDSYAFGTMNPDEPQTVGPLGWVRTEMAALGVAGSVVADLNDLGSAVANATTIIGLVAVPALVVLRASQRRAASVLLLRHGYSFRQRWWWFAAEAMPTLAVVGIAVLGTSMIADGPASLRGAWVLGALALVFVAGAGWSAGSRARRRTSWLRPRVRKASRAASTARLLRSRLPRMALLAVLIGGVALSAVAALAIAIEALDAVSITALGSAVATAVAPALFIAIGLSGIVAGVVLAAAVMFESTHLRGRSRTLVRMANWNRAELIRTGVIESAITCGLALLFGFGLVALASVTPTTLLDAFRQTAAAWPLRWALAAAVLLVTVPVGIALNRALTSEARVVRLRAPRR